MAIVLVLFQSSVGTFSTKSEVPSMNYRRGCLNQAERFLQSKRAVEYNEHLLCSLDCAAH